MRLAALAAVAAFFIAAPSASAATTWYVDDDQTFAECSQAKPCKTIGEAVTKANSGDTIQIASGSYSESVATAKRLTFDGAGAGPFDPTSTLLQSDSSGAALELRNGGTVRDMIVIGSPAPGLGAAPETEAILLNPQGPGPAVDYTLANVLAKHGHRSLPGAFPSLRAVAPSGRQLRLDATDVDLRGAGDDTNVLVVEGAGTVATFDRLYLDATGDSAGAAVIGATLTLRASVVRDAATGVRVLAAGKASIIRSDVSIDRAGAAVEDVLGDVDVTDSYVHAETAGGPVSAIHVGGDDGGHAADVVGSTVVARSPDPDGALTIAAGDGDVSSVSAVNSVFRVVRSSASVAPDVKTFRSGGQLEFTAVNSYFTQVDQTGGGSIAQPGSGTNVAGDGGFVDPAAGDWRLRPDSQLIDRGDPAVVTAGERDFPGAPRSQDGDGDCFAAPDIGAYERPTRAPAVPCTPQITKVRFKPRRLRVGRRGRLSLTLSREADLTIRVQRRREGKFGAFAKIVRKSAGPGPVKVKIGPKVMGRKLRRGRYRIKLSAVDAVGRRSKTRRVGFRVVRAHGHG